MPDSDPELPAKPLPPAEAAPAEEQELFPGLLTGGTVPKKRVGPGWRKKMRSEMGFFEHLEELRMTVIKCAGASLVGMAIMSVAFFKLFQFLKYPLVKVVGEERAAQILISPLQPTGMTTLVMSVTVYGGVLIALPASALFIVRFIAPGLTDREKKLLQPTLLTALGLFFTGVLLSFFFMLPAAIKFFLGLDHLLQVNTQWTLNYYYSLVMWATLGMGLVFEFPLILVILQVLDIIEPATLRSCRRYAIVIIAVIGMLIAPSPDPFSMLTTMTPMLVLYEASIIAGGIMRRRKAEADARRDAERAD
jgi:sec-independent protein translocase protein TatC